MRKTLIHFGGACLVILTILALVGCGGESQKVTLADGPADGPATETTPANEPQPVVDTPEPDAYVQEIPSDDVYQGVGSFVAFKEITVSPKVGGTIVEMAKDEGDRVTPKTVVARIDDEEFELALKNARAQLAVAQANLNNAKSEYNRKKNLFDDGAIPESQFDQFKTGLELAEAQMDAAKVAVEMAEKALRDSVTYSGVTGIVSGQIMEKGEFIGSGDPMIVINIVDPIKLSFSVPQHLAAEVADGAAVHATLSAYPGRTFKGVVSLVSPVIDAHTRTVKVEASFDNADGLIKPGFFAECTVDLQGANRIFLVPNNALYSNENGLEVHVMRDGVVETINVNLIKRNGSMSRVTGNLNDGEKLELQY